MPLMDVINSNKTTKIHLSVCVNEKENEKIMLIRKLMITMWEIKGQVMIIWINYCLDMIFRWKRRNDAYDYEFVIMREMRGIFLYHSIECYQHKKKCISCSVPYEVVILINRSRGLWILHVSDRCPSPSLPFLYSDL